MKGRLNYILYENKLHSGKEGKRMARVMDTPKVDQSEMVKRICHSKKTLDRELVGEVIEQLFEEMKQCVRCGERIDFPVLKSDFTIKGSFDTNLDYYDKSRHQKMLHLMPTEALQEELNHLSLNKKENKSMRSNITEVIDGTTRTINQRLTPLGVLEVIGQNIKISDREEAGVFFVNQDTHKEYKALSRVRNKPKCVIVQIPNLEKGRWRVTIKSSRSKCSDLFTINLETDLLV